jgi:[acyl-carrier-protein] S-malonyltransferase
MHKTQVTGQRIEKLCERRRYTENVCFFMMTAFVFPGQGSQYVGMGKSLAEKFAAARAIFNQADQALGFSLTQLCFEGPAETLQLTENMQPALLTVSVAAWQVLDEQNVRPDFVAGHSLGEYSALVAAKSLAFADAVRLVRKRGQYMQEAVPVGVGAMAALLRLPAGKLDSILAEASQGEVVTAANFNSPDQVAIAGHAGAVSRAVELAKAAGARRALLLPVSAPFHCPLMEPAQSRLKADLEATEFRDLATPLVNGWQAKVIRTGAQAREGLHQQVPNPVRWTEVIQKLASLGVGRFVEVGAGGVLTGLLRNIDNQLEGSKFGEAEDLEKIHVAIA